MSKKHFVSLAQAMKFTRPEFGKLTSERPRQWNSDVESLANVCALYNERFNYQEFYKACGGLFEV